MTTHVRKQIRDAIKVKLTGLASTASNVFADRVYKMGDEELPAINIMSELEQNQAESIGFPRLQSRDFNVSINGYAKSNSNLDDVLDQICLEVETALAADISLGGLCKDLQLISTTPFFDGEGEKPRGAINMLWLASYRVVETAPGVAL